MLDKSLTSCRVFFVSHRCNSPRHICGIAGSKAALHARPNVGYKRQPVAEIQCGMPSMAMVGYKRQPTAQTNRVLPTVATGSEAALPWEAIILRNI